jgi:ABC-2 type transport system ATP-binding protein
VTVETPAVSVNDLHVRYGSTHAVRGLTFHVAAGTVTAVLGRNGAGKTSTIEICEGYRSASAGSVRVWGLDPVRDGDQLRPRVGVMLQDGGIYGSSKALPMLKHVSSFYANPLPVDDLAVRLELTEIRSSYRRMSGGEKQRLALACAIIGRPDLVFLDEPTSGMDPQSRRTTWELIEQLRRDGVTIVLTTHLLDEVERLADHVVIIDKGQLIAQGSVADLTEGTPVVTFRSDPDLAIDELQQQLPAAVVVSQEAPGQYRVEGSNSTEVVNLIGQWCAKNAVVPRMLSTGTASLEDVFLSLTHEGEES